MLMRKGPNQWGRSLVLALTTATSAVQTAMPSQKAATQAQATLQAQAAMHVQATMQAQATMHAQGALPAPSKALQAQAAVLQIQAMATQPMHRQ